MEHVEKIIDEKNTRESTCYEKQETKYQKIIHRKLRLSDEYE